MTRPLALVLSGAVSLGAYEAGIVHEILFAAQTSSPRLRIDVLSGSSAGALNACLAAFCLHTGTDPAVLRQTWVDDLDIMRLLSRPAGLPGPLTSVFNPVEVRRMLLDHLRPDPSHAPVSYPVWLGITRTDLTGRSLPSPLPGDDLAVTSFASPTAFILEPASAVPWEEIARSAAASGAFPVAVEPEPIGDRRYADGGVLDNRPLRQAFEGARRLDGPGTQEAQLRVAAAPDARSITIYADGHHPPYLLPSTDRVYIMVEPGAPQPVPGEPPRDPLGVASRVMAALTNDDLLRDLRDAAKVNRRLNDLADLARQTGMPPALVEQVRAVADLDGKRSASLVRVAPDDPARELAGAFLGHFGGFLERRLREHDYRLGRVHGRAFLERMDVGYTKAAASEYAYDKSLDGAGYKDLTADGRRALARAIGNATEAVVGSLRPGVARPVGCVAWLLALWLVRSRAR